MQKFLVAIVIVLVVSVSVNAQYLDLQRSPNIGNLPNVICPEITNDLSHLGATYTLGTEAGNLTGEYGRYMQLRLNPIAGGISAKLLFFEADGTPAMVDLGNSNCISEVDLSPYWWESFSTYGLNADFDLIIGADLISFSFDNILFFGTAFADVNTFGAIGGYIDYFAVSGSSNVSLGNNFAVGGGWITKTEDGFVKNCTDMQILRGFASGFTGNPEWIGAYSFGTGSASTTWSSRALACTTVTGLSMQGTVSLGGFITGAWNNLTFTFGSFERVPAAPVPEPATLAILGLGLAGLPIVRRFRKK